MRDREPTIRNRALGEGLRRAMEQEGLSGTQVAHLLGWSASRISRLLSGKRGGSEVDVSAFLAVCRVKGATRDRLLRLCREQNTPGWFQQHGSRLPKLLLTLIDHEDKATKISEFNAMVLPGLLQTGDYARAIISRMPNVPTDEVDDRVATRLARQSLLSRANPPRCFFYVHESVLRLPVGNSGVMSEQLHHLLRLSARSHLTLRVVPVSIGAHAGIDGSFQFMEFEDFKPVVYLENATSSLFLENPEEIQVYQQFLAALMGAALEDKNSQELIANIAAELYTERSRS